MIAPFIPFITEEIYQNYFRNTEKEKSIHISKWPEADLIEKSDDKIFDLIIEIISKIRQEKTKNQKAMNSEIILTIDKKTKEN